MEEILNAVLYEIENSGYYERLSAGIVVTGGGALLKDLPQLVKFVTGMDVRLGYPGETLASESVEEVNNPMFSTSVGLVLKGFEFYEQNKKEQAQAEEQQPEEPKEKTDEGEPANGKKGLFGKLKQAFNDIFEENDAEM
jgi:cell division protein FtsA